MLDLITEHRGFFFATWGLFMAILAGATVVAVRIKVFSFKRLLFNLLFLLLVPPAVLLFILWLDSKGIHLFFI